ncbi:M14 family zinc carboxypeptidase [Lutibacter holmesii]|uniref:M14 family zinc carboxypeptidase n=1 Tax=Lutibacter holmesii TaxID=1137985 RepID=A0ABW3WNI1_9FLAO
MHFKQFLTSLTLLFFVNILVAQNYFLEKYEPFNKDIPSPEEFLGYGIGEYHTRHDLIVAYFEELAKVSDKAEIEVYGKTHEKRKLVMLRVSNKENLTNIDDLKQKHLNYLNSVGDEDYSALPVFVNLGYGVHGNEPSSAEAALLVAYTLVASENPEILNYVKNSIVFIDPAINPDGRDRHTQWANQYRSNNLVSDNVEAEHNEAWPKGRTNHYWFDLNRDWLLAVHPESQSKLNWYHSWYPNVTTDFHEMGTNSTYFFEPKRTSALTKPLPPKENYEDLNNMFAKYFQKSLDSIGGFYFTSEAFDGTYPGYGSTYPDLQGGLGLLFEQASSRGHVQDTDFGKITFPFTIRNQYVSSLATLQASVENKDFLRKYQQDFFNSAKAASAKNGVAAYEISEKYDNNRKKAFVDFLLKHNIEVYKKNDQSFIIPLNQPQKRMVQTMFETNKKFVDSVFYDASAWNVVDFYNIDYKELTKSPSLGEKITETSSLVKVEKIIKTNYAYILDWDDYNASAALYFLQTKGLKAASAFKPFTIETTSGVKSFNYGSMMFPVSKQTFDSNKVYEIIAEAQEKFNVPIWAVNSGMSSKGIPLGSRDFIKVDKPKVAMLIGDGVSPYEAGEVWHLLDTRIEMPITKIQLHNFNRVDFSKYNTLVMVSGSYYQLDSLKLEKLQNWVKEGNTLVTIGGASKWAVSKKVVAEKLVVQNKDSVAKRVSYVNAAEDIGKQRLGGAIFEVDLDVSHPLGFGYRDSKIPVYKNNLTFIKSSKNIYSTVAKYTNDPLINGFISPKNLDLLSKSASLIVSPIGRGRVILFADNPNFRGAWYGTNKMFMNALFFGSKIRVPKG